MPNLNELEAVLERAIEHHLAGQAAQARQLYEQVLSAQANSANALHGLARLDLQAKNNRSALNLAQRAITAEPTDWRFHCTLGQVLLAVNQAHGSAAAYRRAVDLKPGSPDTLFGLGMALQAAGRRGEAIDAYRDALAIKPDFVEALNNLGNAHSTEGRPGDAIEAYRRALTIKPDYFECLSNLGAALHAVGELEQAIDAFSRALTLNNDFAPLCSNLGNALAAGGRWDEAIAVLRRAVELAPNFSQGWYNLGNALSGRGLSERAAEAYRRAVQLQPDYAPAHINLGNALLAMGDFAAAAAAFERAITLRPNHVDAYSNAARAVWSLGQTDRAVELLQKALAIQPDFHVGWCNLGNVFKDTGRLDEALDSYRRAIDFNSRDVMSHSNLAYAVYFHPGYDAEAILRENLRWDAVHGHPLAGAIRPWQNDSSPRRLRIGYVSPDFREHCQSLFTTPLLSNHDHERFEIFCYANVTRPDERTQRLTGCADVWRLTHGLSDDKVAEMIRADGIDILVDLTMHMSHGRPLLFARKPAPVQVAWLAYPGTTGMAAMDYRLTDPWLDPPGETDRFYREKSIRLPDTFWCYDPMAAEPVPNALPVLAEGCFTFGCLNNPCKLNEATLALWAKVMAQVAGSRLLLLSPPGSHRGRTLECLAAHGIVSERVEILAPQPRPRYLEAYHRIDLGLDTFPYNGHTTSLDSFWMGVPVVTRVGGTAVGRAGWSQLCNLNLRELAAAEASTIAASDEEFIRIAVELANDLPRLGELRSTLRPRMRRSPLMDAPRFARNIEAAYRRMWEQFVSDVA